MVSARDLAIAAASCGLTLLVARLHGATTPHTLRGRPKATGDKAFVLAVSMTFTTQDDAKKVLDAWQSAAEYCLHNEPFLYAYEMAQSDKNPLMYTIIERYRSKEDYLGPHRASKAFHAFRPVMRELQEGGRVVVTGESYNELGIGFT